MAATKAAPCLELRHIGIDFHRRSLLEDISLRVEEQEIVGIIGPNGVGKTTLFHIICGQFNPTRGAVFYRGQDITGWPPHRTCRLGIGRTFQVARPFPEMTVLQNVSIGLWFGKKLEGKKWDRTEEAFELLDLVSLRHKAAVQARELTVSELRRLEVARALGTKPQLLLLDEIAAGLSPQAIREAVDLIRTLSKRGLTLLIIDHFLNLTTQVSDRLVALCNRTIAAEGKPADVLQSPEVVRAYLGRGMD